VASIILELQKDALDEGVDIVTLLRKVFLVSTKLNLVELKTWTNNELNGYQDNDAVPEYRKTRGELKSFNRFHGWIKVNFADSEWEDKVTLTSTSQSIAAIQRLKLAGNAPLTQNFNGDRLSVLQEMIGTNNDLSLFIPITTMDHILSSVRNTILDWSLKLEQEGIFGQDLEFSGIEKERASMTTNIKIENFQGVLGDVSNSEVTQNLDMNIDKNNFDQLSEFLKKNEVSENDIVSLNSAIETDGCIDVENGIGEQVSVWIGNMVSKSASGSWNVSIAAAGNLLATAISKYYGM
jgi:hypothetical protein